MRLVKKDPKNFINRTVVTHGRYWLLKAVHPDHIELLDPVRQEKGRLQLKQWDSCRIYPERSEIAATYPRLVDLLREVCLLTRTEAEMTVLCYLVEGPFYSGSEAVSRIGGTGNAIRHALMHRQRARQGFKREKLMMQAA